MDEPAPVPVDGTLDLHAFHPRDVRHLVPDWLAACRAAGLLEVRVIHGKGTGALRASVLAQLERLPIVAGVRADSTWGAAIVALWDPSGDEGRVRSILAGCPRLREELRAVASVGPPGAWIGAGAVRNRVWHRLHGGEGEPPETDVDVVWCGSGDEAADRRYEASLGEVLAVGWEVADQARFGATSVADGIAHWPETATALAVRGEDLELLAPHGLADLLGLVVRPPSDALVPAFRARLADKRWRQRFPWVRIDELPPV